MKQVLAFLVLIIATTAQMNLLAHSVRMIISSIIQQKLAKNAIFLVALLVSPRKSALIATPTMNELRKVLANIAKWVLYGKMEALYAILYAMFHIAKHAMMKQTVLIANQDSF